MKMRVGCNGCFEKMLKISNRTLNTYKSKTYLLKKSFTITVNSYENKKILLSPDRSGILFPASLAGKRYSG
ncbi:hypothetical protein QE431_001618 [Flavobacterium sp. SORGH_AS 622]|nr:hypothetical protein [Flavobacterium sp. SORGH_AS_0622]